MTSKTERGTLESRDAPAPRLSRAGGLGGPVSLLEAKAAAYRISAAAAVSELCLHAERGDVPEVVMPAHRASYDRQSKVIQAERRLAVTLLRFSRGRGPWQSVETAAQLCSIRRRVFDGRLQANGVRLRSFASPSSVRAAGAERARR